MQKRLLLKADLGASRQRQRWLMGAACSIGWVFLGPAGTKGDSGLRGALQRPLALPAQRECSLPPCKERTKVAQAQAKETYLQLHPFLSQMPECKEMMQDLRLFPSPLPPGMISAISMSQPVTEGQK